MTRRSITMPPPENDHLIVLPNDKPTSGTCTVCKKKVRLTPISTCCFHPGLGARKCDGSFEFPQEHECNQEEEKPKVVDSKEEPKSPVTRYGTCPICNQQVPFSDFPGFTDRLLQHEVVIEDVTFKCEGTDYPIEFKERGKEVQPPKEVKDLPRGTTVTQLPPKPQPKQHKMFTFRLSLSFDKEIEIYHMNDDGVFKFIGNSVSGDVWATVQNLYTLFGKRNIEVQIEIGGF